MKKAIVFVTVCVFITITLCSCKTENTKNIISALKPALITESTLESVRPQLETTETNPYKYWTTHKLNNSDFMFWDMATNSGTGCGLDTFTYYTQLINPTDAGYELGCPPSEMTNTAMTEKQVLYAMSGITEGEWFEDAEGNKTRYTLFRSEVYQTNDLEGHTWDFFVYDYALETQGTKRIEHYYNVFGATTYCDMWLTIELTGTLPADTEQIAEIKEIFAEFTEIYGFTDKLPGTDKSLYLLGLDNNK